MDKDISIVKSDKTWDQYIYDVMLAIGGKSKDPNTKVGAVIVTPEVKIVGTGYNGFPSGVLDYKWR